MVQSGPPTFGPGIQIADQLRKENSSHARICKPLTVHQTGGTPGLEVDGLQKVIGNYQFTEKPPMRDDVISILTKRPTLKERGSIAERVISKIKEYVETFIDGVD